MHTERTILLVEDNEDDALLARRSIERQGLAHRVILARTGPEALDYLFGAGSLSRHLPDLVLLDLELPGMGGAEVLRRIRVGPRTYHLPVVIFTSMEGVPPAKEAYGLGVNSFVRKPDDAAGLARAILAVARYWLDLNTPDPRPAARGAGAHLASGPAADRPS